MHMYICPGMEEKYIKRACIEGILGLHEGWLNCGSEGHVSELFLLL